MPSKIAKVTSRLDLARLKFSGQLPQVSWSDLGSMLVHPNSCWPTHKLATPKSQFGRNVRFETPIGEICWDLENRHGLGLLVFEKLCGVYERGPVRIRKGDIVLDLGANVGTFTRFALNRGAAKVVAVEPEPSHVELLKYTFADEIRHGSVTIVPAAVWKEEGLTQFESAGVGSQISETGSLTVTLTTVDKIVSDLGLEKVSFIKADIEGAERHALAGATETLKRFGPQMAICIYHLADDPDVIPQVVRSVRPYQTTMNAAREQVFFRLPQGAATECVAG